jgi:hypothetical protein
MIEIAPSTENWMTYDNAVLYCQFLEYNEHKDWRLPTELEAEEYELCACWTQSDRTTFHWYVVPVRTVC